MNEIENFCFTDINIDFSDKSMKFKNKYHYVYWKNSSVNKITNPSMRCCPTYETIQQQQKSPKSLLIIGFRKW